MTPACAWPSSRLPQAQGVDSGQVGHRTCDDCNPTTPQQFCSVSSGTGTIANANLANISVVCSTALLTIGGTATGLAGGEQVVLQNNLGDNLTVTSIGIFAFAMPLASGKSYSVTVPQNPIDKG